MNPIKEFLKKIAFRYFKLGIPTYRYNIEPIQLACLINEIERLKDIDASICEIGVARGLTTRFIAEHISNQNIEDMNQYYAIDTFDSFTKSDLEFEVKERGKKLTELKGFEYNSLEVWKNNFSEFSFIKLIQADCSEFDFNTISPVKLTFLYVDFYLPTKKALENSFNATIAGGVIIVDDVREDNAYDGAHQAYMEFCKDKNIQPLLIGNKCGIIYKD